MSSSNSPSSSPPDYEPETAPTLPGYPTSDDPSPPEYFEIIRFNASSYSWHATNAQLQAAINAGGISPTTTPRTAHNEARSVTTAAVFYLPQGAPLHATTTETTVTETERQNGAEGAAVVRSYCRPTIRPGNSVRGLSSILERWSDLLEEADQQNHASSTYKQSATCSSSEARTVPSWGKARIIEQAPKDCRKWAISRLLGIC